MPEQGVISVEQMKYGVHRICRIPNTLYFVTKLRDSFFTPKGFAGYSFLSRVSNGGLWLRVHIWRTSHQPVVCATIIFVPDHCRLRLRSMSPSVVCCARLHSTIAPKGSLGLLVVLITLLESSNEAESRSHQYSSVRCTKILGCAGASSPFCLSTTNS